MNRDYSIDEWLVKYLLGEATADEHIRINKWRTSKPENEQYFAQFKLIWDQSKTLEPKHLKDEAAAWECLQNRIKQQGVSKVARKFNLTWTNMLRVAAVLILMIGVGYLYIEQSNTSLFVESGNQVRVLELPDGSTITLNKYATLSYPKRFIGKTRRVSLTGEAFFDIIPNKQKPFVIHANQVVVKVLGTSFNVKTEQLKTEVIVETGIVEVTKNENKVEVHPREKLVVNQTDEKPIKEMARDALYNYYRTNEFVCDRTPLWRIVEVLNEAYHVHILISDPSLKELPLTTTFKNESLNNILNIIAVTLNLQVERTGNEIVLK